ncbi:MAG: ABC transporter permease subunit [Coriobacteriia bacterium]|nr:ABC transporter permease subunit [Coriobacteriia bacterium]
MDWTILRASLQLRRVSLFWYSVGLAAYGWMIVAFFPLIEQNPQYIEAVESVFTEELLAAFGGAGLEFTTLGGFLGIEYLSLIWVFIVGAAVITFIAGALGGAVEDGTMEVTLAQPVSRTSVVLTSYLGMVVYAIVLNLVTVATIYLPGLLHGVDVPLDAMGLLFVAGTLVTLAIGSFAFAVSAASSGKGRTTAITLGVLIAMYLADLLGNLTERAEWLKDFSLFHYWRPAEVIDDLELARSALLVFGVATVLFSAVGMYAFRRRDVV